MNLIKRPAKAIAISIFAVSVGWAVTRSPLNEADDWPTYGGGLEAQHYSARAQINRGNVQDLIVAWTFHTNALQGPAATKMRSNFEANPVFWDGRLYFDTPYDEVFAIGASTGEKAWSFDPGVNRNTPFGIIASRGVVLWHSARLGLTNCDSDRVFVATLDRRLIAMDARTGVKCLSFGREGEVDLAESLNLTDTRWYSFTSPPTVVGDVVAIGSSVGDNQTVEAPSGAIRGFDARSGKLLWSFEPLPWAEQSKPRSGSGGAWSVISADAKLGLLFVPTGSPSVDFFGAYRPGDNKDANSVVALEAKTGRRVWGFQVVHHDLWDLDVAAEPLLFIFHQNIPAVAVTTKMGMTFVLDRRTGEPLFPVTEVQVPKSEVPGEQTSPTQPYSSLPLLAPMTIDPNKIEGRDNSETEFCLKRLHELENRGEYTPVGLKPTLLYPGNVGGVNWGSPALDPETGILYANVNRLAFVTQLIPRDPPPFAVVHSTVRDLLGGARDYWEDFFMPKSSSTSAPRGLLEAPDSFGSELSAQLGTPYKIYRAPLLTPSGLPCVPGPWGAVVALDLNKGVRLWSTPIGTLIPGRDTGAVTVSGPIVTAGGIVFTGGGTEPVLHAYDAVSGSQLWEGNLPVAAQATPMTYEIKGRQYIVIAAGGHSSLAQSLGDSVVAFALPLKSSNGGVASRPAPSH